jgi:hypothetical protein
MWTPIDTKGYTPNTKVSWNIDNVNCYESNRNCHRCTLGRMGYGWDEGQKCHIPYAIQTLLNDEIPVPKQLFVGRRWHKA